MSAILPSWISRSPTTSGMIPLGDGEIPVRAWLALEATNTAEGVHRRRSPLTTVARTHVVLTASGRRRRGALVDRRRPGAGADATWTATGGEVVVRQALGDSLPPLPVGRDGALVRVRGSLYVRGDADSVGRRSPAVPRLPAGRSGRAGRVVVDALPGTLGVFARAGMERCRRRCAGERAGRCRLLSSAGPPPRARGASATLRASVLRLRLTDAQRTAWLGERDLGRRDPVRSASSGRGASRVTQTVPVSRTVAVGAERCAAAGHRAGRPPGRQRCGSSPVAALIVARRDGGRGRPAADADADVGGRSVPVRAACCAPAVPPTPLPAPTVVAPAPVAPAPPAVVAPRPAGAGEVPRCIGALDEAQGRGRRGSRCRWPAPRRPAAGRGPAGRPPAVRDQDGDVLARLGKRATVRLTLSSRPQVPALAPQGVDPPRAEAHGRPRAPRSASPHPLAKRVKGDCPPLGVEHAASHGGARSDTREPKDGINGDRPPGRAGGRRSSSVSSGHDQHLGAFGMR